MTSIERIFAVQRSLDLISPSLSSLILTHRRFSDYFGHRFDIDRDLEQITERICYLVDTA